MLLHNVVLSMGLVYHTRMGRTVQLASDSPRLSRKALTALKLQDPQVAELAKIANEELDSGDAMRIAVAETILFEIRWCYFDRAAASGQSALRSALGRRRIRDILIDEIEEVLDAYVNVTTGHAIFP
jgi:hypothetical protein